MELTSVIHGDGLFKKYGSFELDVPVLDIPQGFATALIGENGAGKSTLLDILAGIRLDYKGSLKFFGKYDDNDRENNPDVKNAIGYEGTGNYYLPMWTLKQGREVQKLLFRNFDENKYIELCRQLAVPEEESKKISDLSDGNHMKIKLAGVLSRDTDLLILDEPASPLDPLMRDKLCDMIREYLQRDEGGKSVLFSTHNISDMEAVTDYAIIVENGKIVEQGFVEDLKEKYVMVKGEKEDEEAARKVLYSISSNTYGFEGICLSGKLDELAGMHTVVEPATLSQICVAVMKNNSKLYGVN
ncbi:MAG: ABC transporter ATP-binding protein [Lachnospiraceae bacterium]|nr:ABC transporter ATP-binding protein [Lachnospiraceae bacterium]